MEYLIGLGGILLALFFVLLGKKNNAEALLKNVDVKNQVNNLNAQNAQDQTSLNAEATKRAALDAQRKEQESENPTQDQLLNDLNKPDSN